MKEETLINQITTPQNNPLLVPGVLIPFKYGPGILKRYKNVREKGRVVIEICKQLNRLYFHRVWFTTYGEKRGKHWDINIPELEEYAERYWSLPLENYEWLLNICKQHT
jgi:hypothetical protein